MGSIPIARSAAALAAWCELPLEGGIAAPVGRLHGEYKASGDAAALSMGIGQMLPSCATPQKRSPTRSDQRERPTPPRAAARTKRPRRLGEDLVDDFAVDVGESAVDAVVAEGETLVVDA